MSNSFEDFRLANATGNPAPEVSISGKKAAAFCTLATSALIALALVFKSSLDEKPSSYNGSIKALATCATPAACAQVLESKR